MLNDIGEEVSRFAASNFLVVSAFEHYTSVIQTLIKMTSPQRRSTLEKSVQVIKMSAGNGKFWHDIGTELHKEKFLRDRRIFTVSQIEASTLFNLAQIRDNVQDLLVLQCLETTQHSSRFTSHRLFPWLITPFSLSRLTHRRTPTLDSYGEHSGGMSIETQVWKSYTGNMLIIIFVRVGKPDKNVNSQRGLTWRPG